MSTLRVLVDVVTRGDRNLGLLSGQLAASDRLAGGLRGQLGRIPPVVGAIGGAFAAAGIVDFLADATSAAAEEEAGIARLTTSLEENSRAFTGNVGAVEAVIDERMALGFTDDEQRASLAKLTGITEDHTKALELQRTAMDFARLRGLDLSTAGDLIGKVYGGNIGILSRYGIQLERGTTATEALARIQRMSAGQAEAWAETSQGAFETAGIALEEVTEDIGGLLIPVMVDVATVVRDDVVPAITTLVDVIGTVSDAVGVVAEIGDAVSDSGIAVHDFVEGTLGTAGDAISDFLGRPAKEGAEAVKTVTEVTKDSVSAIEEELQRGGPVIAAEAGKIAGMLPSEIQARVDDVKLAAEDMLGPNGLAGGILAAQQKPLDAIDELNRVMAESMSALEQIAELTGEATVVSLQAGLSSPELVDRLTARSALDKIITQLNTLGPAGYAAGVALLNNLGYGLSDSNALGYALQQARQAAGVITAPFPYSEPKDPLSPLRNLDQVGVRIVDSIASGITHRLSVAENASQRLSGALAPSLSTGVDGLRLGAEGGGMGVAAYHTHIHLSYSGDPPTSENDLVALLEQVAPFVDGRLRLGN